MSATAQILEKLTTIENRQATTESRLDALSSARNTGAVLGGSPGNPATVPMARRGPSALGSSGFSFGKFLAAQGGDADSYLQDDAKNELAFAKRYTELMMKGTTWRPSKKGALLVPIWPEALDIPVVGNDFYYECKTYLQNGTDGADPDEVSWLQKKFLQTKAAASPAQSWVDQTLMGSFVPPPTFGPPIELLRSKEALMSAGATVIPLGPSGRITLPRLTSATQGDTIGENTQETPTQAKTGALTLSAKKSISVVVLPNELLRFASPAAEVLIRGDMMKTVALIMDYNLLQGSGGANTPLGLVTMIAGASPSAGSFTVSNSGINVVGPTTSNQLAPQDAYTFLAAIEESNGDSDKCVWIMRPQMKFAWYQTRWTPYSGGTNAGGFVFDLMRGPDGKIGAILAGCPIVSTPQVSKKRGSGAQTYVICLQAEDYVIGMFGAIEFTQTDAGYTLLSSDQTAIRALCEYDGGPRHPGLVAAADALNFTIGP